MLTIKGTYRDGKIQFSEPVPQRESQVLVIFLDEESPPPVSEKQDWEAFNRLIAECQLETGITDLAHQHDHYLYGKPKQTSDE